MPPKKAATAPAASLAGKNVVFTGTLSIDRKHATRLAKQAGAAVADKVTAKTNLLVCGEWDFAQTVSTCSVFGSYYRIYSFIWILIWIWI